MTREAVKQVGERFALLILEKPNQAQAALSTLVPNPDYGVFEEHVPQDTDRPVVVVPDARTYLDLISKVEVHGILNLGGLVSAVENISFDQLRHSVLERHKVVILFFPDTPEADVTEAQIRERYPHLVVKRVEYGIPRTLRVKGLDEETIKKAIGL